MSDENETICVGDLVELKDGRKLIGGTQMTVTRIAGDLVHTQRFEGHGEDKYTAVFHKSLLKKVESP